MAVALDYGSSGLGSSPGCGHCVVFLGNTLYVHAGREVGGGGGGFEGWASILFNRSRSTPISSWRYPGTLVPDKSLGSN